MNRRELLGSSLTALLGGGLAANAETAEQERCGACGASEAPAIPSPHAKLSIKPVMTDLIHTAVWEGPCRFNVVTVDREAANVKSSYEGWVKALGAGEFTFGEHSAVLDPLLITFSEAFRLPPEQLLPLERDAKNIDAFFIRPNGSSLAAFDIVSRYHKPGILLGLNCRTADVAAYARSRGEEIFVPNNNDELRRLTSLLRARKVFRETRVLFPTDRGFPSVASLTGITDLQDLQQRLGVGVTMISFKELSQEVERVLADPQLASWADSAARELMNRAVHSYLERKYVAQSLLFKQAVNSLMERHGANAFTIECFEFCASRLPEKWKITPCLLHTLYKDAGYASSCEGDMGALLAMRLLMSVSGKSSHLGNMFQGDGNSVVINHSAPGLKMNGFDAPPLEYKLGRFTQSGWGTKAVVDFAKNGEKRATVARMHPNARKLLVMKGQLVGSVGWEGDNLGCSVEARIKPAESGDGLRFIRKQTEYGNHLVWTYGDYSEELKEAGELLGLEVEVIA